MAVLRLLLWCGQNADLGAKLPLLATYLGHVGLASSQRYLQLTQDLMGEITRRHQARFGYLINEGGCDEPPDTPHIARGIFASLSRPRSVCQAAYHPIVPGRDDTPPT